MLTDTINVHKLTWSSKKSQYGQPLTRSLELSQKKEADGDDYTQFVHEMMRAVWLSDAYWCCKGAGPETENSTLVVEDDGDKYYLSFLEAVKSYTATSKLIEGGITNIFEEGGMGFWKKQQAGRAQDQEQGSSQDEDSDDEGSSSSDSGDGDGNGKRKGKTKTAFGKGKRPKKDTLTSEQKKIARTVKNLNERWPNGYIDPNDDEKTPKQVNFTDVNTWATAILLNKATLEQPPPELDFSTRPAFTKGAWGGSRTSLSRGGVNVDVTVNLGEAGQALPHGKGKEKEVGTEKKTRVDWMKENWRGRTTDFYKIGVSFSQREAQEEEELDPSFLRVQDAVSLSELMERRRAPHKFPIGTVQRLINYANTYKPPSVAPPPDDGEFNNGDAGQQ
ncbi:hypothetical protein JCM16303_002777 [Sporobolomyces ruberrimus]